MTESQPETPGKHAAPDDDPNSDPPPVAGEGGEHTADDSAEEGDGEPAPGDTPQPGADPADEAEIEADREERLDPDNRPEHAEVDNTQREFDPEKGMFTDTEGYDKAEEKFPAAGEQGA